MTLAVPGPPSLSFTSRAPSIIIIGADAMLAALPATPVQLAHACMKVGYQHVVPASWGDELIASAVVRQVAGHRGQPLVQCTCPLVAHRLLSVGTDLGPFLVSLAPPPVALARYLRALYGASRLRLTYAGRCPGADDTAIDARLTPDELFALFADRHVALVDQPQVFDSVIPPDRRRHVSHPGGVPTSDALWTEAGGRTLVEISAGDLTVELAQLLLTETDVLIDPAPVLGCACSGVTARVDASGARERVAALEPPRAPSPIVDSRVAISLAPSVPSQLHTSMEPAAAPREVMLPVHAGAEYAPTGAIGNVRHAAASASHGTAVVDAAEPGQRELAELPAAELEVEWADPVVSPAPATEAEVSPVVETQESPAPEPELAAPVVASPSPDELLEITAADAHARLSAQTRVHAAVALESPPDEIQDVERPAPVRRRTAPLGTLRAVVGDTPMTRDSSGRQLPRAYVLRRRSSPRSAGVVVELPGDLDATQTSPASPAEESAPLVTPAAPESHVEPAPADPSAQSAAPTPAPVIAATLEVSEPPIAERPKPAPVSPPEPRREQERTVALPIERLSDAPAATRVTPPRAPKPHVPHTVDEKPKRYVWLWIALLVLVVALVGSAAGAAFATWYAQQHPTASSPR